MSNDRGIYEDQHETYEHSRPRGGGEHIVLVSDVKEWGALMEKAGKASEREISVCKRKSSRKRKSPGAGKWSAHYDKCPL